MIRYPERQLFHFYNVTTLAGARVQMKALRAGVADAEESGQTAIAESFKQALKERALRIQQATQRGKLRNPHDESEWLYTCSLANSVPLT